MRRAVISSIARDVAVKLGPLGNALKERLMITGEALRSVHPKSLNGRVPIICDHLKFDSRNWSKAPRRGSVFIFVIPVKTFGTNELVHHQAGEDNPKNDTRAIAEGFQLMVSAQYIEAEFHFKRLQADRWSTARGVRQTISRMLAITSAISNVMRLAPGTVMAPYYRGECPAFETTIEEQVAFRLKQSEVSLPRNFMNAVEDPSSATNIAEVLDSTHRQSGGVSHRRKAKEWRKKARR
ncbi:Hypothetical protein, putative [Bodo saltans]|uniref:Uncharacterized protein n=1 Tax=Bodo saltans TaxID=75058 RepID=A0A0S4JUS0_BODSA|nr:Hypothetical protein, putative [Bodo saltans]|eukprot:CUG92852.1 Hypothetical protein, putative [Bodo saltans]